MRPMKEDAEDDADDDADCRVEGVRVLAFLERRPRLDGTVDELAETGRQPLRGPPRGSGGDPPGRPSLPDAPAAARWGEMKQLLVVCT